MKKLTFTLLLALMAIFSAQAAKVYLKVAGFVTDNNTLTAYAWKTETGDRLLGDWPGTKMALETIGADKYYVCEFDYDGEYSIIFKGTVYDKEQQSIDLTGNIGDCTFVANDNWTDGKWSCDKTEGAPSAETPVETYTVQLAGMLMALVGIRQLLLPIMQKQKNMSMRRLRLRNWQTSLK